MARRLLIATELSENMRRISESGVQHRHPEYSADQVRLGAIRLRIGEALFRRAYPHSNELP